MNNQPTKQIPAALDNALEEVFKLYGVTLAEMVGRERTSRLADPRHVVFALMSWHSRISLVNIGKVFRRDHGTIIHSRNRVASLMDVDLRLRDFIEGLEKKHGLIPPTDRSARALAPSIFVPNF